MTSLDYPGELAAVVFCQGCPWRCRYCHNRHLLPRSNDAPIPWAEIHALLGRRRKLLDAVVFSGGEPTLQPALPSAVTQIKSMGFKIGLHTSGCYGGRLRNLIPFLDWVALDIKALPEDYPSITGVRGSGQSAWKSLATLQETGIRMEVRTTLMPGWTLGSDIEPLMQRLADMNVSNYVIQGCRTAKTLDPSLALDTYPPTPTAEKLRGVGDALFRRFSVREA